MNKIKHSATGTFTFVTCVTPDQQMIDSSQDETWENIYIAHGNEKVRPWGCFSFDFLLDQNWVMTGLYIKRENKVRKVSTRRVERGSEPSPSGELRWKGEEKIREAGQLRTSGHCCWSLSASWQWTLPWLHGVWTSLSSGPCCLC